MKLGSKAKHFDVCCCVLSITFHHQACIEAVEPSMLCVAAYLMTWTCALMTSVLATVKPSSTLESSMNFFQPQSCSFLQNLCKVSAAEAAPNEPYAMHDCQTQQITVLGAAHRSMLSLVLCNALMSCCSVKLHCLMQHARSLSVILSCQMVHEA